MYVLRWRLEGFAVNRKQSLKERSCLFPSSPGQRHEAVQGTLQNTSFSYLEETLWDPFTTRTLLSLWYQIRKNRSSGCGGVVLERDRVWHLSLANSTQPQPFNRFLWIFMLKCSLRCNTLSWTPSYRLYSQHRPLNLVSERLTLNYLYKIILFNTGRFWCNTFKFWLQGKTLTCIIWYNIHQNQSSWCGWAGLEINIVRTSSYPFQLCPASP